MRGTQFAELNAFVAVAERSNFAKAAAHLGLNPEAHNISRNGRYR